MPHFLQVCMFASRRALDWQLAHLRICAVLAPLVGRMTLHPRQVNQPHVLEPAAGWHVLQHLPSGRVSTSGGKCAADLVTSHTWHKNSDWNWMHLRHTCLVGALLCSNCALGKASSIFAWLHVEQTQVGFAFFRPLSRHSPTSHPLQSTQVVGRFARASSHCASVKWVISNHLLHAEHFVMGARHS